MHNIPFALFQIIVLIFSVMLHEVAHGAVALSLGDTTAKRAGRLTLDPRRHIDPFGSVLLPILLFMLQSPFLVGWAKPVPFNPAHLKNPKRDAGVIGIAGPLANLFIAAVFGIFLRIVVASERIEFPMTLILLFDIIVKINLFLAIFNLLPIPPLDGSNVLFSLLPSRWMRFGRFLTQHSLILLVVFLLLEFQLNLIGSLAYAAYRFLTGAPGYF